MQFQVELNIGAWNGKTLIVRGKVDEIGSTDQKNFYTIDVKAFSQSTIDDFRSGGFTAFPHYAWQQSAYAIAFNENFFYMPIYNKDTGKIEEWSLDLQKPLFTRDQIRDRVLSIEEAYEQNTIPQCTADYGCQYYYLHDEKEPPATLPGECLSLCSARIVLSEKIKKLEESRRLLDETIKSKLQQDVTYNFQDEYTITMYANPSRFNTKAAQALLTDAGVDWKNDPDFIIPGQGTQVRFTKRKDTNA